MFGKIIYINDNLAHVEVKDGVPVNEDLMNMHVIFEDEKKKILGEVADITKELIKIRFLGEIVNGKFIGGVIRKPNLSSAIRVITKDEFKLITGENNESSMMLGMSPLYDDCPIYVNVNDLFSNHMAIFGNTGSGKSWGLARLLQNVFENKNIVPFRSNFLIFDAYGEYHTAFKEINKINPNFNFKYFTTNVNDKEGTLLKMPIFLFNVDDLALFLNATEHSQLPIIEKMLKLVKIFAEDTETSEDYKNHLIAKAMMNILYTNQTSTSKRNDIFAILNDCSTEKFNLEAPVQGLGYVRKFRDCFIIDKEGNFTESILVTDYISSFINPDLDQYESRTNNYYTLKDLEKALDFTLISEGMLKNEKTYSDAISLKVKLHSIIISEASRYFEYPNYIDLNNYIASLVTCKTGHKAQIINFNLEDIEDSMAKVITKVYTRMLFEFTKKLPDRASIPFHVFLEEAHRYVQNDNDKYLLGYNIFDRVAKEGRKYGLIFNLISQRPVEISETVISQCSSFLIFKMNHPRDLEYIKKMLPNINQEIIEKQKSLQPGTCVAFGKAFKIPIIIKMTPPDPAPYSSNCDVENRWKA
ncbi:MAG: ATP-binding protein [Lactobacillales bacterium]|nr:ATP-binding protein [Lactobacillales bacterium]